MVDRTHIPNELQRELMLEVGYRCPLCSATEPLEFEHIEEWSEVRGHEFGNMIVLCASCHGRKRSGANPRHINRASLKKLKQTLILLNGRYSDLEKRVIDEFARYAASNPEMLPPPGVLLPDTLFLLVRKLEDDGLADIEWRDLGSAVGLTDDFTYHQGLIQVSLTDAGRTFITNLVSVRREAEEERTSQAQSD